MRILPVPRNRGAALPVEEGVEARLLEEMPAVRGFLCRLVLGRPGLDPDDLVQETMERALKYQDRWDATRPARPWLQGIAFRVFLDARERARRGPRPLDAQQLEAAPAENPEPAEVARLLATLEPRDAAVLRGFHVEGRSVAELAAAHAVAEGTVKSWLHRARKRLAAQLDPEAWL